MATVLEDRVHPGSTGPTGSGVDAAARSGGEPAREPRGRLLGAVVFMGLLGVFALHLVAYGAWVVDDAGISMAYAVNLVGGHGLVAQPGATPVEAYSNPLWVGLLAGFDGIGLLGREDVAGVAGYVLAIKGTALVLHAVVLACLGVVIRRVMTVVRGRPPAPGAFLAVWGGAGLLLAANPSYVVWMGSGLENPLSAALVAAIAAVATTALPTPDRRAMVALGVLAGSAALTRPDGLVYAGVVVVVAGLATGGDLRRRGTLAGVGLLACAGVFGAYLAFRRASFGAWVPNTAVAKDQGLPTPGDLTRLEGLVQAYGWPLVAIAVVGAAVAVVRAHRAHDDRALRVIVAGLAVLGAGVAAFVVLPADWMRELRFLTPVWPLLSAAVALGAAQLVALASSRPVRAGVAGTLVLFGAVVLPGWGDRISAFRSDPTLPMCFVATRYGLPYESMARVLGREPSETTVLLPDIGGVLLASDVTVIDLAGLADRQIARLLADGSSAELARLVLDDLRPTIVHLHGDWVARSGLLDDPQFRADYVDVLDGEDWVRRAAIAATPDPDRTRVGLRAVGADIDPAGRRSACAAELFG